MTRPPVSGQPVKLGWRTLRAGLAFGAGVIPLAFAHGAAAGAQRAVGTGVLGGIITATLLAIFLVPLFFRLTAGKRGPDHPEGI